MRQVDSIKICLFQEHLAGHRQEIHWMQNWKTSRRWWFAHTLRTWESSFCLRLATMLDSHLFHLWLLYLCQLCKFEDQWRLVIDVIIFNNTTSSAKESPAILHFIQLVYSIILLPFLVSLNMIDHCRQKLRNVSINITS